MVSAAVSAGSDEAAPEPLETPPALPASPELFVLIDYENVQPKDVALLRGHSVRCFVLAGQNQKLSFECAMGLQPLGKQVEYVQIKGSGRNALDFHIAFLLGDLAVRFPGAMFCVVSKDKGFEPLLAYLAARRIRARRCATVRDVLGLRDGEEDVASFQANHEPLLAEILDDLRKRGSHRPKSERTLIRALQARFGERLTADTVRHAVEALRGRGVIATDRGRVHYRL